MKADANFFDEDKDEVRSKKMKISDAIEDEDSARKKNAGKKKKKKGAKKAKDGDINMLNVQQVDGDESWNSARGKAKHIDLSNTFPAQGDTPGN